MHLLDNVLILRIKKAMKIDMSGIDSFHNKAKEKYQFLMKEKQFVWVAFKKQSKIEEGNYNFDYVF